jgi:gamma-glutamylcyclotransferase (GGCT)/AIG2-like uncharacterized protein YtfP
VRGADTRLAVYGSLAPGQLNHHQLASLNGRWVPGTVNGRLFEQGWGATLGFPGIVLDPSAPSVRVQLFESMDLPSHWERLDAFEGAAYRRGVTRVDTADGELEANIYEIADPVAS